MILVLNFLEYCWLLLAICNASFDMISLSATCFWFSLICFLCPAICFLNSTFSLIKFPIAFVRLFDFSLILSLISFLKLSSNLVTIEVTTVLNHFSLQCHQELCQDLFFLTTLSRLSLIMSRSFWKFVNSIVKSELLSIETSILGLLGVFFFCFSFPFLLQAVFVQFEQVLVSHYRDPS